MTSVLTDKEKADLRDGTRDIMELIDDVQAAVIKRLAAGVSVEPAYTVESCTLSRSRDCCRSIQCKRKIDVFTLDQLTTAIAAARVQALEEAMKVCEGASSYLEHQQHLLASRDCANAIRALIGGAT